VTPASRHASSSGVLLAPLWPLPEFGLILLHNGVSRAAETR
jgi:hypothetical protein